MFFFHEYTTVVDSHKEKKRMKKMLLSAVVLFLLCNTTTINAYVDICSSNGCNCDVDGGEWVAICETLPPDILKKSTYVDVLELKKCPTTNWLLPSHMELRKVGSTKHSIYIFTLCYR